MPATETAIDITQLMVAHFLATSTITDFVDDRVYDVDSGVVLPENVVYPIVAVHRFGGTTQGLDGHFDRPLVQIDVWGGSVLADTKALVAAVRQSTLHANIAGLHAGYGVVTGFEEVTGPQPVPGDGKGRTRFTWTALLGSHP